jgi:hypothetical protein
MAQAPADTKTDTDKFEAPAEDASLDDLIAVSDENREHLSDTQRVRIDEAEQLASSRVATETAAQRDRQANLNRENKDKSDRAAEVQRDVDYHTEWKLKLDSDDEYDRAAYKTEMANSDNEKRFLRGGVAATTTISSDREREIAEGAVLGQYKGWHVAMKELGHPDVFPDTDDTAGWAKVAETPGGAPEHIWIAAFEAGHSAGKEEGRSEAAAELGRNGRPDMSAGSAASKVKPGDVDLDKPGAGRELMRAALSG